MKNYIISSTIILLIASGLYSLLRDVKPSGIVRTEPEIVDFSKLYESIPYKFSIYLPKKYSINENYSYSFIPDRNIDGVSFGIEESDYKGINLSKDSYISVEMISNQTIPCKVESFLNNVTYYGEIEEQDNHIFAVASTSEAAAGNRYEQTVYVTPVANGCSAIRYFIHYTVVENYPEGAVKEFDRDELLRKFDTIRKSIKYFDKII